MQEPDTHVPVASPALGDPNRVGEGMGSTVPEVGPHVHPCSPPVWDPAQADADGSASGMCVGGQPRQPAQEIAAVVEGSFSNPVHTAAPAGSLFKTGFCPKPDWAPQCPLGWRTLCV